MKLIPFGAENLHVGISLPFDLYDGSGRLMMPRNAVIQDTTQLGRLMAHDLAVDEGQSAEWREARQRDRDLADEFDDLFGGKAAEAVEATSPVESMAALGLVQAQLDVLLLETAPDDKWLPRMSAVAAHVRDLMDEDADALLFIVLQRAVRRFEHYSSRHALLCAMTSALCAVQLGMSAAEIRSLMLAALTMNWSMTAMQDELTLRERTPSLDQRVRIDDHPEMSARQLKAAGVTDTLWLDVVARHHQDGPGGQPLALLAAADRLTLVLRRLDVFFAKISPRLRRAGMPATLAARAACLGANGEPDEVGSAIIKVLGIYPPGTCVSLANGELAVVLRRGAHASQPWAVSLLTADGSELKVPQLRDTSEAAHRITGTIKPTDLRRAVNVADLLAML